jgi:hypothetical protein
MDSPLAAGAKSVDRSGYKPRQLDNGIVDAPTLTQCHGVQVDTCLLTPRVRQKNPSNFCPKVLG